MSDTIPGPIIFRERAVDLGDNPNRARIPPRSSKIRTGFHLQFYHDWKPVTLVNCYLHEFVRPYRLAYAAWGNTQKNYEADCAQFTIFLAYRNKRWEDADWLDVLEFSALNQTGVSSRTRRRFSKATSRRRVLTVIAVLEWAYAKKLIARRVVPEGGYSEIGKEEALPPPPSKDAKVNRIPTMRFQLILEALGPDLSDAANWTPDQGTMSPRLAATVALATGMRITETLSLTVMQLVNLESELDPENPDKLIELKIVETKGKDERIVIFPSHIVRLIGDYVTYERSLITDSALERGKRSSQLSEKIFLNSLYSNHRDLGNAQSSDYLSRKFRQAVIKLGFLRDEKRFELDEFDQPLIVDGSPVVYIVKVNAYTFHDLRHTFTASVAELLSEGGEGDVWKTLQTLLGHEHSDTTRTIYGRHVEVNGSRLTEAISRWFGSIDKTFGGEI